MTTDSRKIQLETAVDASGAKAGFQQVKDSAKDMAQSVSQAGKEAAKGIDGIGDGAGAAGAKVDRATANLIGSIQRATAAAEAGKKSGSAFYESLAGQRGANLDTLKPYLTQLDAAIAKQKAAQDAMNATAPALDKVGISAKQTAAALRGVPAQFTDIVTSLQGGQAPLTVLLQQGGQLKDMFGGIGPAAKALGGYIGSLINPFTLAAGAVALLGAAFYSATSRTQEFNKAIITTGDYIGKSAGELNDLAKAISSTIGTQGQAADALTALAGSGKIAGESLRTVGEAVVAQNKAMGTSIEEAVGQFVKLAEEPTKASAKLNESLHYLNQTTYDRIRALEDQGRKEEAAALAQDAYAKATVERMNQVINQSGLLSKALSGTKDVAMGMWNAIAGGLASIGAQASAAEKLVDAQRKVKFLEQNGSTPEALAKARGDVASLSREALRQQENAYAQGERARNEAAKIAASDRLKTLSDEVKTNADKRKKAIADLDRDFKLLGKPTSGAEYEKLVANINDKFKDPKAAATKAFQDDAATKMLASLRQQEAALKEQLTTDEKLTASEKERAKFVQLVADLKTKGTLTAEQKILLANEATIKAQLDQNVAIEKQVELKKQAAKLDEQRRKDAEEFARQIEGINISIESANRSRADQQERSLEAFGLGSRARGEVEAQRNIRREFEGYQRQLTKNAAEKNQLGSDAYRDETAKIKAALDDALAAQQRYFDALKEKQADWRNGATSAIADYVDYVEDAAGRTRTLIGETLGGFNDVLTESTFTGDYSSWKKYGERIGKQVLAGIYETYVTKDAAKQLQELLGDSDGVLGTVVGLITGGKPGQSAGKAANDSLFARGSTIANPLYVKSVDIDAGSLMGAATGEGGGGIAGVLGSLFGGMSNGAATTAANALPGDSLDNLIKLVGAWGGAFAAGGDPPVGKVSLVGEKGPELFVPKQAGTVIPNGALGGNTVVHINQTFAEGTTRQTADQAAMAASRALQRAQRNA